MNERRISQARAATLLSAGDLATVRALIAKHEGLLPDGADGERAAAIADAVYAELAADPAWAPALARVAKAGVLLRMLHTSQN